MKKSVKYFFFSLIWALASVAIAVPQLYAMACSTEETVLHYEYLGACGHTQTTSFTLDKDTNITKIRIWFDTSIAGETIFAILSGPDGYTNSFIKTSDGPCQWSWCEAMWNIDQMLKAGTYTITADSSSICSNPSGQTTLILYGCDVQTDEKPDNPADNSSDAEGIDPPKGVEWFDLSDKPADAPVYMGKMAKVDGATTLDGKMELSVDFPAYNKPVDIWILIALPDGRFYLADSSGKLLDFESNGFLPIAAGVAGSKTTKTILNPFDFSS
ncbi:MAG: hypothetical protein HQK71_12850, partial [Desulfamplus sp.]|nr:hypothetical protein [Desulfamplus sp.]